MMELAAALVELNAGTATIRNAATLSRCCSSQHNDVTALLQLARLWRYCNS